MRHLKLYEDNSKWNYIRELFYDLSDNGFNITVIPVYTKNGGFDVKIANSNNFKWSDIKDVILFAESYTKEELGYQIDSIIIRNLWTSDTLLNYKEITDNNVFTRLTISFKKTFEFKRKFKKLKKYNESTNYIKQLEELFYDLSDIGFKVNITSLDSYPWLDDTDDYTVVISPSKKKQSIF